MYIDLINLVFKPYLDSFVIVFIGVIHVYLRFNEEHVQYLRIVLQTLRDYFHFAKFSKCEFWHECMTFLGHVVSKDGIMEDPEEIEIILE